MGRLIEEAKVLEVMKLHWLSGTVAHHVIDEIRTDIIKYVPTVEAITKADYENRLKADLVAMLRFLWNEIEDLDAPICDYASSDCISKWQVNEVIQQKINSLKE